MKKRFITALILIAITLPLILLGGIPFAIGIGLLGAIALWELLRLRDKKKPFPMVVKVLSFICLELTIFSRLEGNLIYNGISYLPIVASALALLIPSVFTKKKTIQQKMHFIFLEQ